MKVFIAGNISDGRYFYKQFVCMEYTVSESGHEAVNPVRLLESYSYDEDLYMESCIELLKKCKAIYFMDGWKNCKISYCLYGYALAARKKIMFEGEAFKWEKQ